MVKNRHLSKSIADALWTQFCSWVEYFGKVFGFVTVPVPPHDTSQNCSNFGDVVKKSLSSRTHTCYHCGHTQDRDGHAARNFLEKALSPVGYIGINA
ncbi:transposase [Microcoleus sp. Pol7_A1]|uniref:transposase n=1 Tax=Microcoleus sp. Pol7_A1 TaxID=2818893 RepID=UPI002FCF7BAA